VYRVVVFKEVDGVDCKHLEVVVDDAASDGQVRAQVRTVCI
jgi:hypothetical protein